MNRIFCIIGKSGTGKNTLVKTILSGEYGCRDLDLTEIVPVTTRPKRPDEVETKSFTYRREDLEKLVVTTDIPDYVYVTDEEFEKLDLVEQRSYKVANNDVWKYGTPKLGLPYERDYILITTPDAIPKIQKYYEADMFMVITCVVCCAAKTRITRMLDRGYGKPEEIAEQCRRYLADEKDFRPQVLSKIHRLVYIPSGDNGSDKNVMAKTFKIIYNEVR